MEVWVSITNNHEEQGTHAMPLRKHCEDDLYIYLEILPIDTEEPATLQNIY